ncbi:HEAT repeat domain-containing protein, partial [Candidatus Omnitrophota bacterium]
PFAIEGLQKVLGDRNKRLQRAVAEALVDIKDDIPSELREPIKRLYSARSSDQVSAAKQLGSKGMSARLAIPFLISVLGNDASVGEAAAGALSNIGKYSIKPLVEALESENPKIRANAAWALGQMNDLTAVRPLVKALCDDNKKVGLKAMQAIINLSQMEATRDQLETANGILLDTLNDPNAKMRASAAKALGNAKDPLSVRPLMKVLKDSDPKVRLEIVIALDKINDTRAKDALVEAIRDISWEVQVAAIGAVGGLGDLYTGEHITPYLTDVSREVRVAAAEAIGELKYKPGIKDLFKALQDPNRETNQAAAEALSKITGKNYGRDMDKWKKWRQDYVLKIVLDRKATEPDKLEAAEELSHVRDSEYIESLILALHKNKTKEKVRYFIAIALRKITGEDYGLYSWDWKDWWETKLPERMLSKDRDVRYETAKTLGRLKSQRGVKYLVQAMGDTFPDIRDAASHSLYQITGVKLATNNAAAWTYWWQENKENYYQ